jgi:hypothetical protein
MITDPLNSCRLRNLPPYAKTFVGIFTALMLCVGVWAVWIFSARYGGVDQDNLPAYLRQNTNDLKADIDELKTDSSAVMAPVWDKTQAGREQKIDSATLSAIEHRKIPRAMKTPIMRTAISAWPTPIRTARRSCSLRSGWSFSLHQCRPK